MTLPMQNDAQTTWSLERAVASFLSSGFNDGDMVSHEWLEFNLELPTPKTLKDVRDCQWIALSRVEALKSELLKRHNICLANVYGQGYRVVPPAEQGEYALRKTVKEVSKAIERGSNILNHTRLKDLSVDEMKKHTDIQVKMAAISEMAGRRSRKLLKDI